RSFFVFWLHIFSNAAYSIRSIIRNMGQKSRIKPIFARSKRVANGMAIAHRTPIQGFPLTLADDASKPGTKSKGIGPT
ncbi:MAG: hypothetical protein M1608_02225, partial [Candidatus Omnitrophica bacterium]|nr:hypothetical protein [Candidatus Omnitrophota bacterium]